MVDRILLILKVKNLTASKFADEIGVQRSSISHILSGRNLPSLNLIQKILKTFPEVSSEWLLNGVGPMSKTPNMDLFTSESKEIVPDKNLTPDLFNIQDSSFVDQNIDNQILDGTIDHDEPALDLDKAPGKIINTEIFTSGQGKSQEKLDHQEDKLVIEENTKPEKLVTENKENAFSDKKIEKIVIFYNNKTFREYFPE
jgi:transcriptional regulator with XRE-family HTH domain